MPIVNDRNAKIVEEFRANDGRVAGPFENQPLALLHYVGRKSGEEYLAPAAYLAADDDPSTIYVFASAGGRPEHPQWYRNMTAAGEATVEVGSETYPVVVTELTGAERDRVFAEQARRNPGFAEYERNLTGVRTIPVLALRRAA
jgi:deazaflavin-dependent oxidoreductase (nitroreductase family)